MSGKGSRNRPSSNPRDPGKAAESEKRTRKDARSRRDSSSSSGKKRDLKHLKEIAMLSFINPGPSNIEISEFNPETSNREKRKLSRLLGINPNGGNSKQSPKVSKRPAVHDANGIVIATTLNTCDCLDPNCSGCHFACEKCHSKKCGAVCRCDRKWTYEQVSVSQDPKLLRAKRTSIRLIGPGRAVQFCVAIGMGLLLYK